MVSASSTILLDIRVQMGQNTSLSKNVNVDAEYAQKRDKNIAELKSKLKNTITVTFTTRTGLDSHLGCLDLRVAEVVAGDDHG